ncbi:ABC transporter substrate-binding protein [Clostridium senegalense]|uniref:ABC transporter substrate-binding protein n=1 Tax=Clostridium senegalense TaxID=1465809 RepID=UPI001C11BD52|nr:ABC transporter substrate-binding protein [Clostridium senegalense]MBU5228192.1 ABC transporter substrate-binding protein [Clostridium senegalense]
MKKVQILALIMVLSIGLTGCGVNKNDNKMENNTKSTMSEDIKDKDIGSKGNVTMSEGKGYPIVIKDMMGNEVTLQEKPKKIAAASSTFLGSLYAVGGESICTPNLSKGSPAPKEAENLPTIGKVYNPDVEKLISLKPDLVIAQFGIQNKLVPTLKESNIPVLVLQMKTYDEVLENLKIMGRIVGNEDKAEAIIDNMNKEKNSIVKKLPKESKKIVILYATSNDISVKLENSIAGNVAEILKLNNIASGKKPEKMGDEAIPFSIEEIVKEDPDVILVTSMVKSDEMAKEVIEKQLGSDPVWKNLKAVKDNKIVYLPQKYFLYNAGENFVDGIEFMAKGVYPEIYGELNEK